jgi:protoporphyrinogen oxidase
MGDADSSKTSTAKRIAIIGTGPLSLLKAHFLSQKNPSLEITLIDSGSQIGGAWYSDFSPKGHLIECGCHIWSYAPLAYQFIEKELGVKLFDMTPPPIFVGKTTSLPYSLKNTLDTYKTFVKYAFRFKFSALVKNNQKPYIHYKVVGKKNKYPLTGSPELIHSIERLIRENKQIKIILNTRVTEMEIGTQVRLISDQNELLFDQVLLTYVSHIQKLIAPNATLVAAPRQVDYVHFLLSSDQPLQKKLTYWRLMNDPVVHRITDISYQSNHEENLFLVGIKGDAFHAQNENQLFSHVINLMRSLKLISSEQKIERIKTHVFPTFYMDKTIHNALMNYPEKVETIPSTDLMYGLHYLLEAETPHLIKTPK